MEFFQTLFDSLKREMHQEFDDVKARLDRMEARHDRQGGLLQGGGRARLHSVLAALRGVGVVNDENPCHVLEGGQFCPQPASSRHRRAQLACSAKSRSAAGRVPA